MEKLRACIFAPYGRGGLRFKLTIYDTGRTDSYGKTCIGYELRTCDGSMSRTIFEGKDFYASPMHADDSDETVRSLMTFLTLRPGDTDSEYFEGYTEEQRAFCDEHAEALAMEVMARFGEDS